MRGLILSIIFKAVTRRKMDSSELLMICAGAVVMLAIAYGLI